MSESTADLQITQLLNRFQDGDREALEELMPLVYRQLCLIARNQLRGEKMGHTFATSDLVHEAYFHLFTKEDKEWVSRVHFFAVAGRAMRYILINYAKSKNTQKRGGSDFERAAVAVHELGDRPVEVLSDLDEALKKLEKRDQESALAVELRHFCGFTHKEMSDIMSLSVATIKRKLNFAQLWLDRYLNQKF